MQQVFNFIIGFVICFCIGEILAWFIFERVRKRFSYTNKINKDWSIQKGIIERAMILLGLVVEIPSIIVFFGAIKLGTRLKDSSESAISNDYFLVGNAISVIIVLVQFLFFRLLFN